MESKLILENLQRYTKELEEQYPNETAYWHLQKLRNEIERVKNIAYEPVLADEAQRSDLLAFMDFLFKNWQPKRHLTADMLVNAYLKANGS